jgi:hypothetical protein
MKQCYNCKSVTTYKSPSRGWEEWRFDKDKNRYCLKCYNRLIYIPSHKEQRKIWAKKTREGQKGRRIYYRGKRFVVKTIVRTGLCAVCNDGIGHSITHLHHELYDDNNFLKHTVELCPKHHREASIRLGQFRGRWG